jgi:hypothetical protein
MTVHDSRHPLDVARGLHALPKHESSAVNSDSASSGPADKSVSHAANSRFSMRGCRITHSQLDRIWRLAILGFSQSAYRSITTTRKSGEMQTEIKAQSVDEILANVRKSTIAGDPNKLDNLALWISNSYLAEDRSVRISIDCNGNGFFSGAFPFQFQVRIRNGRERVRRG